MGHPVAEHLPEVAEALEQRGFDDVDDALKELARMAGSAETWSEVADAYAAAEQSIRSAMADVDDEYLQDPGFLTRVLTAVIHQSRHEYDEAVNEGEFVNAQEYHDSRGFMQIGRTLLEERAEVFREADADAYAELVERFEAVMEAWPSVQPPESPVLTVSEVYGRASAFEFAASRY
jgi:hypothetical protein